MQIYALKMLSFLICTGLQGQTSQSWSFWPVILLMILNPWHKSTGESQFVIAGAEDNLLAQIRDIHDSLAIRWSRCDPIPWAVMMTNVKWSQLELSQCGERAGIFCNTNKQRALILYASASNNLKQTAARRNCISISIPILPHGKMWALGKPKI